MILRQLFHRFGTVYHVRRKLATDAPAIFIPPKILDRHLPSDNSLMDPLEGPSGISKVSIMAQLRQLYYEEDEESALKKSTGGREGGEARVRRIRYTEGEVEGSDLEQVPSRSNPHPFDGSSLPPTHSRTLTPFVNHVPLLQILVDLGVDLFEIETRNPTVPRHLLRLPFDEARGKLRWLISIGFSPDILGEYLTRNPYVLLQNLNDMKARVNFLASYKFTNAQIFKLVSEFRYWLNLDIKTTESRLEWVIVTFGLKKSAMRKVLVKEPRLFMFGMGPIKRIFDLLTNECQFSTTQVKNMLMDDPRLFMMDSRVIMANFVYAKRVMNVSLDSIASHPLLLRVSLSSLRCRHEFLRSQGRTPYCDSNGGESVSLSDLLVASDAVFAEKVALVTPSSYDIFLRTH